MTSIRLPNNFIIAIVLIYVFAYIIIKSFDKKIIISYNLMKNIKMIILIFEVMMYY